MTKKIQIPGTQTIPTNKVIPPTATQIEQIWLQIPEFGKAINQLAYQIHNLQQQLGAVQMAQLEGAYLIKHLADLQGLKLPSLEDVRTEIRADRITFLQAVLESDGINEDQKVEIKKQITELQSAVDAKANVEEQPTEESPAAGTEVAAEEGSG